MFLSHRKQAADFYKYIYMNSVQSTIIHVQILEVQKMKFECESSITDNKLVETFFSFYVYFNPITVSPLLLHTLTDDTAADVYIKLQNIKLHVQETYSQGHFKYLCLKRAQHNIHKQSILYNIFLTFVKMISDIIVHSTGTCFIQKIYAPSSSLLQGKHLPFSPSPQYFSLICYPFADPIISLHSRDISLFDCHI